MRLNTLILLLIMGAPSACFAAVASNAAGPTATAPLYEPAPWWARSPVIAATGEVRTHVSANRASFSARFSAVDPSLASATRQVADKVKTLASALRGYGADRAQVDASLSITPIYQQYRDKQGDLQDNNRADRIERYEASVRFSVQLRDLSVLERAYAAVVSAHPASIDAVSFSLEPDDELNTSLFRAALSDAARRARLAVEATGGRLGRVLLIDPSARACETDVLITGAPRLFGEDAGDVHEVVVPGVRRMAARAAPPPPPPPSPAANSEEGPPADILPLQPPMQTFQRKACVIYSLD